MRRQLLRTITIAMPLTLVTFSGCSRQNALTAISPEESGVKVIDIESALSVEDWGAWRGPSGDGIARQQELVTTWDEELNVIWRADIPGRGHSSPIVVGDAVFVTSAIDKPGKQLALAYRRTDGSELWRTVLHECEFPGPGEIHQKTSNANSTIVSDGNRLYAAMYNSGLIIATALDFHGEVLWQKEIAAYSSPFGYAASPIVYKSLVVFSVDHIAGGCITAFDGVTGKTAWRVPRSPVCSYSSPIIANVGGVDQLLISGGDAVTSYNPTSGDEFWKTPCIFTATCGTIVTTNDKVFASGGSPEHETVCLSATGERLWSSNNHFYEPSPIISGNYLVGVDDNGIAVCWDTETGERKWRKRLGGNFSASPILVGEMIYASNLKGQTFVFRADEEFELVAENRLGDDVYASPAVSASNLFLRIGINVRPNRREQLVC
ncbi:MAG: PQQ-binding-like beta-propeller repeat protein, partial [Planctomycetaceae bacterium]|nr:PQQ-binding-like beta-propeller repeat protein [Planctomycetaceae bacterium]